MRAFVCIITYNRPSSLRRLLGELDDWHAVVDDGSVSTPPVLLERLVVESNGGVYHAGLDSDVYQLQHKTIVLGRTNVGVAGNMNRALSLFLSTTSLERLLLYHDDIQPPPRLSTSFGNLHDLVRRPPCLAVTRRCVMKIGYFDPQLGQGHMAVVDDYAYRAQQAGLSVEDRSEVACGTLDNRWPPCFNADDGVCRATLYQPTYRPFLLKTPPVIGVGGVGLRPRRGDYHLTTVLA